jgi:hypothetical protein
MTNNKNLRMSGYAGLRTSYTYLRYSGLTSVTVTGITLSDNIKFRTFYNIKSQKSARILSAVLL